MREQPHEVLGVRPGATRTEIKEAYYKQAKTWHPDVNNTDFAAERFRKARWAMNELLAQQVRCEPRVRPACTIGVVWEYHISVTDLSSAFASSL
jgi:hypothetical protein